MGRRSRKRASAGAPRGEAASRPLVARPDPSERPRAPWHPFPLVELCVLLALVLLVWGLIDFGSERGRLMLVFGMLLGSLGGLDTVAREHFSGFRSHAMVLAALPAVAVAAIVYFSGLPWPLVVVGAVTGAPAGCFAGNDDAAPTPTTAIQGARVKKTAAAPRTAGSPASSVE